MNSKKMGKKKLWGIIAGLIVVIAVVVVVLLSRENNEPAESAEDTAVETGAVEEPEEMESESAEEELPETVDTEQEGEETESEPVEQNPENDGEASEAAVSDAGIGEERMEAPYEDWLSAAVLTAISMEHPAFEPGEFYRAGDTELGNGSASAGVYITFSADGEAKCIHAVPLDGERSAGGTKDVYTDVIGFASFDEVSPSEIPGEFYVEEIEGINELITQSTSVSLYAH